MIEGRNGQIRFASNFVSKFRKCLIALHTRYVGGIRRFASFGQMNEKAFVLSVSGHKYFELNFIVFLLISETNLSSDVGSQRCSELLIKR